MDAEKDLVVEDLTPPTLSAAGEQPVFTRGLAKGLPFAALRWENFERLLHRIARESLGWTDVHTYGTRGQKQFGIDVVGRQPDGTRGTIQSKRYQSFDEADLIKALDAFDPDGLPVGNVERLIVATSTVADRRQIVDTLAARQDELEAANVRLQLEFWNAGHLDEMLRPRADLVTEFFGTEAAKQFCGYRPAIIPPAKPQNAVIAEMVVRGPTSDQAVAAELTRAAELMEASDFEGAAGHFTAAQEMLVAHGFPGHAQMLDERLSEALVAAGRRREAALMAAGGFWEAVEVADSDSAHVAARRLAALAGNTAALSGPDLENDDSKEEAAGASDEQTELADDIQLLHQLSEIAAEVLGQPVGTVATAVDDDVLAKLIASTLADRELVEPTCRLLAFLAETSGSLPLDDWTVQHADLLRRALGHLEPRPDDAAGLQLCRRLEMELARSVDGWTNLLSAAARRQMSRQDRAIVQARAALSAADRGEFEDADVLWQEAVESACLDGNDSDAAEWVYARRNVKLATQRFPVGAFEDDRLAAALRNLGGGDRQAVVTRIAANVSEAALGGRWREAALAGRAYLRLAYTAGSWRQVGHAAGLLARVYKHSQEHDEAVRHLVATGAAKEAAEHVASIGDRYVDVTSFLDHPSPLVRGSAFKALSREADLLPDDQVATVVTTVVQFARSAVAAGALPVPQHNCFLAALEVLAGLARRLDLDASRQSIALLGPFLVREPGRHLATDDSVLRILNGIGVTHPDLTEEVVELVINLLADDALVDTVRRRALPVLRHATDTVVPRLQEALNDGAGSAVAALLAVLHPEPELDPTREVVAAARQRLLEDPDLDPDTGHLGTNAINDSLLLAGFPADERQRMIVALLRRVEDEPPIKAVNWPDYLIAAFNLASGLAPAPELFGRALTLAGTVPDADGRIFDDSPLALVQMSALERDSRPAAAALAARLASTTTQRQAVEHVCLGMLPWRGDDDGRHLLLAFRELPEIQDLHLLVSQGTAGLRALAAQAWVRDGALDSGIGSRLATDGDYRVRMELAAALASAATHGPLSGPAKEVVSILQRDARHSVRVRIAQLVI
ncbi:hypothetical protein ACWCOV_26765 [Kribbella sp. NPDC002412]